MFLKLALSVDQLHIPQPSFLVNNVSFFSFLFYLFIVWHLFLLSLISLFPKLFLSIAFNCPIQRETMVQIIFAITVPLSHWQIFLLRENEHHVSTALKTKTWSNNEWLNLNQSKILSPHKVHCFCTHNQIKLYCFA